MNNSEGVVGEPSWNFCIPEACNDNDYFQPDIFNIAPLSPHLSGSQVSNGYGGSTLSPTVSATCSFFRIFTRVDFHPFQHPSQLHAPSETYVTGRHDPNGDIPHPSNSDASLLYQQPIDSAVSYGQGSSSFVPGPTSSTIHQTVSSGASFLDSTHGWTSRMNNSLTTPSSSDPPTSDAHRDISSPHFQPTPKLATFWASRSHQEPAAFRSSTSTQSLVVAGPSQSVLKLNHHVKKTGASEKKQYLACLFCRERKIACGRPAEGSADSTCK